MCDVLSLLFFVDIYTSLTYNIIKKVKEGLKMFEWKVEEMALMNNHADVYNGRYKTNVYACENSVSREDKIAFVDSMQDGKLSYLLSLIEKFSEEKDSLPHKETVFGGSEVKTVSLKSWINRNDKKYTRPIIDKRYNYGKYNILGCERYIQTGNKGIYDYYEDLVDEVFHRQLMKCEAEEQKYFSEHDEYSILKNKFRNRNHHTTFGVNIRDWSSGRLTVADDNDNERDITIDELKELLFKYAQIDALVDKLTAETHIVY